MDKIRIYRLADQSDREAIEFDMNQVLESGEWEVKEISFDNGIPNARKGTVFVVFHKVEKTRESGLLND